jgi:hypothetical protein
MKNEHHTTNRQIKPRNDRTKEGNTSRIKEETL